MTNENEINMGEVRNYLDHLDKEGLYMVIQFLLLDSNAKDTILSMAQEWNKMYPVMASTFKSEDYGGDKK